MAPERFRVAVFIDWQNVYRAARRAFDLEQMPSEHGNFSPLRISRLLAAANGRGAAGELVGVEIFRGLPSRRLDRLGHLANRRQAASWKAEAPGVLEVRTRPLRYPPRFPEEPPIEKGVDVELAVGAIEATLRGRCDVAIVFSHDADLLPVPEAIARLAGPDHVETASWASESHPSRLRGRTPVVHHAISRRVFDLVQTPVNYARRPQVGLVKPPCTP